MSFLSLFIFLIFIITIIMISLNFSLITYLIKSR
nr:MAG TPA: protein of unknown function (DUF4834) [Caudoviricetes sp.]